MFMLKCSLFYLYLQSVYGNYVFVNTTDGEVMGRLVTDSGYKFYAYQRIPYAEPPVGPLRFKPPVKKSPWTGSIVATSEPPLCPQTSSVYTRDQMSEDCLYLNVFVPYNRTGVDLLPVAVYVHGGEFKSLSSRTDYQTGPHFFTQRDVILVTINYRLGPLGFLSLNFEEALGNMGLKDVVLGLSWIQDNIKYFGGDPNKVTLCGQSAGAVIVHYLTLTTKTTGLFQRAFLNSGSALGYRFFTKHPVEVAFMFGQVLGINTDNKTELLQSLERMDAFDLITAAEKLGANDTRKGYRPFSPFTPTAEIDSSTAIITREPYDIVKSGIPQNVPIIAGFTAQDGLKMYPTVRDNPDLLDSLEQDNQLLIPSNIEYPYDSDESLNLAECIKQFYFGDIKLNDEILYSYVNLITDTQFAYGVDSWIRIHKSRNDSAALYYYVFDFDGDLNWFKIISNITKAGTGHADDLGYLFLTNATRSVLSDIDTNTKETLNNILTYWTNFVKYGVPELKTESSEVTWTETGEDRDYLQLNDSPAMAAGPPIAERMEFWQRVYDDYYLYLSDGGFTEHKVIP